jgi:hypothetical protein
MHEPRVSHVHRGSAGPDTGLHQTTERSEVALAPLVLADDVLGEGGVGGQGRGGEYRPAGFLRASAPVDLAQAHAVRVHGLHHAR